MNTERRCRSGKKLILLLCAFFSLPLLYGETAAEILSAARLMGSTESAVFQLGMEINTPRGVKTRDLEIYSRDDASGLKVLAQITAPAFLTNMKFLTIQDEKGSEAKWMKTSRGVQRLSEANYGNTLFDSDFTVEDLSRVNPADFHLTMESGDPDFFHIQAEPVKKRKEYARKTIIINRTTLMIEGILFMDAGGTLLKQYELLETVQQDGILFPLHCRMTNVTGGTWTTLFFRSIQNGAEIPDRIFNRAGL